MAMLRMQSCNLTSSNTTTNNKGVHLFGFLISHCHLLRFSNSRTLHSSHRRRRIPTSPIYCLSKSNVSWQLEQLMWCVEQHHPMKLLQIYNHSESVALVVDSPNLLNRLSESFISKAVVRFVILLRGEKSSMSSEVLEGVPIFNYNEILHLGRDSRRSALDSHKDGENVEPSILEEAAEQSKVIQKILVIGQDQRRLGALIFPNKEEILALAKELSMVDEDASEVGKENMINLLQKELSTCDVAILENSSMNKPVDTQSVLGNTETLYQFYNGGENRSLIEAFNPTSGCTFQIGPILILNEPFTTESGLMTPIMKIRRDRVVAQYSDQIAKHYK